MNIDTIVALRDFLTRYPDDSYERQVIESTIGEIENLNRQLKFQIKLADDNNNSRLRLLDVVNNCTELFQKVCVDFAVEKNNACDYCRKRKNCNGDITSDCFDLDISKFQNIVFERDKKA